MVVLRSWLSILFLLWGSILSAQDEWTLSNCRAEAVAAGPYPEQQRLIDRRQDVQDRRLQRALWPQLSFQVQAGWQSEVTSVPISLPGLEVPTPPQDQYRATLDLQQMIWDGGRNRARRDLAATTTQAEGVEVALHRFEQEAQIGELYFGILLAERQAENAVLLLNELQRSRDRLQAAVDNGVATLTDLNSLDARWQEAQQQLLEAESRRRAALQALAVWLDRPLADAARFALPDSTYEAGAEIHRPELDLLQRRDEQLRAGQQLAAASRNPSLGVFLTGGYGRPGLNLLSDDFSLYAIGGLRLQAPLSHLYTGAGRLEQQELSLQRQQLREEKEGILNRIEAGMRQQQEAIVRFRQLMESDRQIVRLREQVREASEAQLANGVITGSDYLREVDELDRARKRLALHRLQWLQAIDQYRLLYGKTQ